MDQTVMDAASLKRLSALLETHGEFELAADLDGTMSTVSANPRYELVAIGWEVVGRDAVREMYRRLFSAMKVLSRETRVMMAEGDTLCYEGFAVREFPDGLRRTRSMTVVTFEGDLVSSERIYQDSRLAQQWREALGADFGSVPGVSELN